MPLLLSVVAPTDPVDTPPERENATVLPPVTLALPFASLAVRVNVMVWPDATVEEETVTVEVAADGIPGITITVGKVEVIGVPPIEAAMVVPVPDTAPVKLEVYVPLRLSVTAARDPVLVPPPELTVTVAPPVVRALPNESRA